MATALGRYRRCDQDRWVNIAGEFVSFKEHAHNGLGAGGRAGSPQLVARARPMRLSGLLQLFAC
jgi:hypothetical protein